MLSFWFGPVTIRNAHVGMVVVQRLFAETADGRCKRPNPARQCPMSSNAARCHPIAIARCLQQGERRQHKHAGASRVACGPRRNLPDSDTPPRANAAAPWVFGSSASRRILRQSSAVRIVGLVKHIYAAKEMRLPSSGSRIFLVLFVNADSPDSRSSPSAL